MAGDSCKGRVRLLGEVGDANSSGCFLLLHVCINELPLLSQRLLWPPSVFPLILTAGTVLYPSLGLRLSGESVLGRGFWRILCGLVSESKQDASILWGLLPLFFVGDGARSYFLAFARDCCFSSVILVCTLLTYCGKDDRWKRFAFLLPILSIALFRLNSAHTTLALELHNLSRDYSIQLSLVPQ